MIKLTHTFNYFLVTFCVCFLTPIIYFFISLTLCIYSSYLLHHWFDTLFWPSEIWILLVAILTPLMSRAGKGIKKKGNKDVLSLAKTLEKNPKELEIITPSSIFEILSIFSSKFGKRTSKHLILSRNFQISVFKHLALNFLSKLVNSIIREQILLT